MEILSVFLAILEFIGIALLVILGILIVLICLILFGGIRYYLFFEKKDSLYVDIKISFLWFMKFVYVYNPEDEKRQRFLKVFFFKFFDRNAKKKDKKTKNKKKEKLVSENDTSSKEVDLSFFENENVDNNSSCDNVNDIDGLKTDKVDFQTDKQHNVDEETENSSSSSYDMNKFINIVKNIFVRIKAFVKYPQKGDIIKYSIEYLKALILAINPKKFELCGVIGLGDPASTGQFIGFISIISEFLPFETYISGDFENEVFEGSVITKGKTNVFKIAYPTLKYIFKEPIWRILKEKFS